MPRVSVVIPVLGRHPLLDATLHSVREQTCRDWEILIIDAEGQEALEAAAKEDRRVRIVVPSAPRLAGARNAGIRAANAPVLAFLNAGDRWHPEKLALHLAHLAARQEVGVSYSQSVFIDAQGRTLPYFQTPKLRRVSAQDIFLRNPVGNGSSPVVRRQVFDLIARHDLHAGTSRCFDESLLSSDDVECWTRIALTTHWRFEGLARPLTLFRAGDDPALRPLERDMACWDEVVKRIAVYAPFFARRWGPVARGYQFRYLARYALREGRTGEAWNMLAQALYQHPGLLIGDAPRTVSTLAAAACQAMLPRRLYAKVEAAAMRLATELNPRANEH